MLYFQEGIDVATLIFGHRALYEEICQRLENLNEDYNRLDTAINFLHTARNSVFSVLDVANLGHRVDLFLAGTVLLLIDIRQLLIEAF